MIITLSTEEVCLLWAMIEDEQNSEEYEQCWMKDQREMLDKILCKLKCGFGT